MSTMKISNTYGALLLGALTASLLTGITTNQVVLYFKLYPEDKKGTKALVALVWTLDTLHSVFIWHGMWFYFIENFGDASKLQVIPTSIGLTGIVTAILTMFVHFYYARRIFRLSNQKYWLAAPIVILAVCRVVAASSTSSQMFRLKNFSTFTEQYKWLLSLGLAISSIVDVMIAVSMFVLLWVGRKRTLLLTHVLDSLILYTLGIGSLTGCATVAALIIWLTVENKLVFLALHFTISKLYANSLLASLNARYQLRRANDVMNTQSLSWRGRRLEARLQFLGKEELSIKDHSQHVEINVERSIHYDSKVACPDSESHQQNVTSFIT